MPFEKRNNSDCICLLWFYLTLANPVGDVKNFLVNLDFPQGETARIGHFKSNSFRV